MKSSQLGQLDNARQYGETGLRFVQALREWLITAPEAELVALRSRLSALFTKLQEQRRAA